MSEEGINMEDEFRSTKQILEARSKLDLSYADRLLKIYKSNEISSNPILRLLNGESLEAILEQECENDIHRAYRDLAKKHHPDVRSPSSAEEANTINHMFILIADAYARLRGGGIGEIPVAIDVIPSYFGYSLDECPSSFYANLPSRPDRSDHNPFTLCYAFKTKQKEIEDINPDLSDIEMAIAYGVRTVQAHEWETYHLSYVAVKNMIPLLDLDLRHWHPINRSIEGACLISTSIMKGRNGGAFLCPTALAPQMQESEPGRLDDIFRIYTGSQGSTELMKLPRDIVAVDDGGYSLGLSPGEIIRSWVYLTQLDLNRIVQQYNNFILKRNEEKQLTAKR